MTRHKVGDLVGVGCMIDSCGECEPVQEPAQENYCESPNSWLATYNGPMVPADKAPGNANIYGRDNTFGGYSNVLVVKAGLRGEDPLRAGSGCGRADSVRRRDDLLGAEALGRQAGKYVGIVGFGGLGNMGAKIAKAMGAHVTIFTRSREKVEEATQLGFSAMLEERRRRVSGGAVELRFHPLNDPREARHQSLYRASEA